MARSTGMVIPELMTFEGLRAIQEKIDIFNEGSNGTIILNSEPAALAAGGDYQHKVKFARPSSLDIHVDEANPGSGDSFADLVQARGARVFQSRRGGAQYTRDEIVRGVATPEEYTIALAQLFAEERLLQIRNALVGAAVAAIDSMDTPSADYHILDVSTGKATSTPKVTVTFAYLNQLFGKMRDAREKIRGVLMPGAALTDLIANGLDASSVGSVLPFYMAVPNSPQLGGRTVMSADIASLYTVSTSSYYDLVNVLGLAAGALQATIVKEDAVSVQEILTDKVKHWVVRQDYDVAYSIQGMRWGDTALDSSETINPTDAELATASMWEEDLSDHRECGIVKGVFNSESL